MSANVSYKQLGNDGINIYILDKMVATLRKRGNYWQMRIHAKPKIYFLILRKDWQRAHVRIQEIVAEYVLSVPPENNQ